MIRFYILLLTSALILVGCQDEMEVPQAGNLSFSTEEVLFDTVFTSIGSITKRLKVYNDENREVLIPTIKLAGGESSSFDIFVNGLPGSVFTETTVLPNDSLLILIQVTIDPIDEDLPFIVKDSIVFESGTRSWDVNLVAWGQDAHFLSDSVIVCNSTWAADRPYVLYNSILIDTLCTLIIEPGAKIYSHKGSSIFVKGSIDAQGLPNQRILFSNDRLDENFKNAAGQWEGIYFLEGSKDNIITFANIRNAKLGIRLGTPDDDSLPDLFLSETQIENMSTYGILTFTSDLEARNVLVNNCRLGALANVAGGNYSYTNCTFANIPIDFLFDGPSAVFSNNVVLSNEEVLEEDLFVAAINCVFWGFGTDEIQLSESLNAAFSVSVQYSLLKTSDQLFSGDNNIINDDPLFDDPSEYSFAPKPGSPLLNAGLDTGNGIDLYGITRTLPPTIGAVEGIN